MKPIRSILAAVDFSECSDHALQAAADLAKQTGAELHVVHALDLPIPIFNPYAVSIPDTLLTQAREEASRRLREAVERAGQAGVAAKSHLTEVPAAPAIARLAEELGADLVVMGTHGHTGLKHVLLGSVAERTLRLAPCSVLIVKEKGAGAK
jgi:nucleotide-binding universal stress UspA family protein